MRTHSVRPVGALIVAVLATGAHFALSLPARKIRQMLQQTPAPTAPGGPSSTPESDTVVGG